MIGCFPRHMMQIPIDRVGLALNIDVDNDLLNLDLAKSVDEHFWLDNVKKFLMKLEFPWYGKMRGAFMDSRILYLLDNMSIKL